jgi:hypothetical protein
MGDAEFAGISSGAKALTFCGVYGAAEAAPQIADKVELK